MTSTGIHHVTAICGNPQTNLNFYSDTLGMRFIKQTVNFDDPTTYHFYFGDGIGSPGSIVTFFPWPNGRHGQPGNRQVIAIRFSVAEDSLGFWIDRLNSKNFRVDGPLKRFDDSYIHLTDPDGIAIELVGVSTPASISDHWQHAEVSHQHAIRGVHSVALSVDKCEQTAEILTRFLNYKHSDQQGNLYRYKADQPSIGSVVDIKCDRGILDSRSGVGTVHHVAFRAENDDQQMALRSELINYGLKVTSQLDRKYFHSIYFREPGGVLFEIATDEPGFAVDEAIENLGTSLQLPAQYESRREEIVAVLPKLKLPS